MLRRDIFRALIGAPIAAAVCGDAAVPTKAPLYAIRMHERHAAMARLLQAKGLEYFMKHGCDSEGVAVQCLCLGIELERRARDGVGQ